MVHSFFTIFNLHSKRLFHANHNYFPFLVLEYSFLNLFSCSLCKTLDPKALNPTDLGDFICASLNLFIKMMWTVNSKSLDPTDSYLYLPQEYLIPITRTFSIIVLENSILKCIVQPIIDLISPFSPPNSHSQWKIALYKSEYFLMDHPCWGWSNLVEKFCRRLPCEMLTMKKAQTAKSGQLIM